MFLSKDREAYKFRSGILDNLKIHKNPQSNGSWKKSGKKDNYTIKSHTLETILELAKSPHIIHYLSLDIEGSEYNVLSSFNFDGTYKILTVTVEGYDCIDLMKSKGYLHVTNPFNTTANYEQYFIHPDLKHIYPTEYLTSNTKIPAPAPESGTFQSGLCANGLF